MPFSPFPDFLLRSAFRTQIIALAGIKRAASSGYVSYWLLATGYWPFHCTIATPPELVKAWTTLVRTSTTWGSNWVPEHLFISNIAS